MRCLSSISRMVAREIPLMAWLLTVDVLVFALTHLPPPLRVYSALGTRVGGRVSAQPVDQLQGRGGPGAVVLVKGHHLRCQGPIHDQHRALDPVLGAAKVQATAAGRLPPEDLHRDPYLVVVIGVVLDPSSGLEQVLGEPRYLVHERPRHVAGRKVAWTALVGEALVSRVG